MRNTAALTTTYTNSNQKTQPQLTTKKPQNKHKTTKHNQQTKNKNNPTQKTLRLDVSEGALDVTCRATQRSELVARIRDADDPMPPLDSPQEGLDRKRSNCSPDGSPKRRLRRTLGLRCTDQARFAREASKFRHATSGRGLVNQLGRPVCLSRGSFEGLRRSVDADPVTLIRVFEF